MRAGMRPAEFHDATLREIYMFISAANWRQEEQVQLALTCAWQTANLAMRGLSGKMPRLERFLPPRQTKKRGKKMTAHEHLSALFSSYPRKKKEPKS